MSEPTRHKIWAPEIWFLSALTLYVAFLTALQTFVIPTSPVDAMIASPEALAAEAPTANPSQGHHVTRADDGLFHVDGSIRGVPVRFAIDTGASVVVLNAADAERVGLEQDNASTHRIRTASGDSSMTWRHAKDLTVEGKSLGSLDVAVMDSGLEFSLLGLNALSRLKSVTIKNDIMIIE